LSHALNASAISTAENTIEYFMRIPFDCLTKTAHLDRFAATWSCSTKVRQSCVRFRSLARIAPILAGPLQAMDGSMPAHDLICNCCLCALAHRIRAQDRG
jgi:hypothetical protein